MILDRLYHAAETSAQEIILELAHAVSDVARLNGLDGTTFSVAICTAKEDSSVSKVLFEDERTLNEIVSLGGAQCYAWHTTGKRLARDMFDDEVILFAAAHAVDCRCSFNGTLRTRWTPTIKTLHLTRD